MIDARTHHALQRSVRKLAVDLVRDTDARRKLNADTELAEREEQVQLEVSGTATPTPGWQTIDVPFEHTFVMSDDRRMSTLERPHIYIGVEIVSSIEQLPPGGVIFGGANG